MNLTGRVRVDRKTKNLISRIQPHEIAVIDHEDLDEVAARSLVKAKVKAVLNAKASISGKYPTPGPLILIQNNVPLLDNLGEDILRLRDGQIVELQGNGIYLENVLFLGGQPQSLESITEKMEQCKANMQDSLEKFVENTLFHAKRERSLILGEPNLPPLKTQIHGRQVLIVVRGKNYCEDLKTVRSYIREMRPVLIGVDGGADALYENGYKPDLIFGDMDSVSDEALSSGAEIVVHAYTDGQAPGQKRVQKMHLEEKIFAVPGTSEDGAMLLAYHSGAELIVAVGTHSNVIDFLEKGRSGMASTLLTRIKIGSILVDAKGVSLLYSSQKKIRPVLQVVLASAFPFLMVLYISSVVSQLARLLLLKFKLSLGL
ncbi:MAG: putative cytokinetic ring protein SteA [Clostridia bacterium]|jgi:uncharacterized membrane-anchored protein|nr:putative cytokinetic ring protein SteA [Clostridia bacterium]